VEQRQGFTLVEILIVIFIISIVMTFAVLSLGDFGASRRIVLAAEQFKSDLISIQQEAILESTPYGVLLSPKGYLFLEFETTPEGDWHPLTLSYLGQYHLFPNHTKVLWKVLVHPKNNPDIIISPAGEFSEFQLILKNEHNVVISRIEVDKKNNIQLTQPSSA
jgi:general secretion pathway protein H